MTTTRSASLMINHPVSWSPLKLSRDRKAPIAAAYRQRQRKVGFVADEKITASGQACDTYSLRAAWWRPMRTWVGPVRTRQAGQGCTLLSDAASSRQVRTYPGAAASTGWGSPSPQYSTATLGTPPSAMTFASQATLSMTPYAVSTVLWT